MPANDFGEVGRAVRARIASGLPPTPASACRWSQHRHVSPRLKFRQFYQRNRFQDGRDSARGGRLPVTTKNRTAWLWALAAVLLLARPASAATDSKADEK